MHPFFMQHRSGVQLALQSRSRTKNAFLTVYKRHFLASSALKSARVGSQLRIYDELSKSKLSALVVMTTGAGFLMAGGPISWSALSAACIGTSLAASSANTFNQVWETKNDKLMKRTFKRPLPSGRISQSHALAWGATTGVASTAILAAGCNPLTAALGAFNIGLYALVYTPMKTRTEWNTWAGSVVGAIPPVMGWTAATGALMAPEAALVGTALFLWQFPHFFALSWRLRKDYARGGFKMIPCQDASGVRTADLVMKYSKYLAPLPVLSSVAGLTSYMFAVEGSLVNAYLLYLSSKFKAQPNDGNAKKVFMCSLWYLPVVLGCMVFHSKNWLSDEEKAKNTAWTASVLENRLTSIIDAYGPENVPQIIRETRAYLKGKCVHEVLWGNKKINSKIFCPVVVADNTRDSVENAAVCVQRTTTNPETST